MLVALTSVITVIFLWPNKQYIDCTILTASDFTDAGLPPLNLRETMHRKKYCYYNGASNGAVINYNAIEIDALNDSIAEWKNDSQGNGNALRFCTSEKNEDERCEIQDTTVDVYPAVIAKVYSKDNGDMSSWAAFVYISLPQGFGEQFSTHEVTSFFPNIASDSTSSLDDHGQKMEPMVNALKQLARKFIAHH